MNRTIIRPRLLAGALLAGALALAGCSDTSNSSAGDHSGMSGMSSSSSSASHSADFNDADVSFAQNMIPHHQSAIDMAKLADGRSQNTQVRDLASRIQSAQGPEIQTLQGWLEDWGQPTAAPDDMGGMDMGGSDMGQMDTSMLESASGTDFDRMFLQMMIEHHGSAVEMAKTEIADGKNESAKSMAQQIVDSQSAEIQEMQGLLTQLG